MAAAGLKQTAYDEETHKPWDPGRWGVEFARKDMSASTTSISVSPVGRFGTNGLILSRLRAEGIL